MTEFYTNVARRRNKILYRGYKDGRRIQREVNFRPELFVKDKDGPLKSIYGDKVSRMDFSSMSEAKKFSDQYSDVENFPIFGMQDYVTQFIYKNWPGMIEYAEKLINIVYIDIEVKSKNGFPFPDTALQEIDLITVKSSKSEHYYVFSLYQWDKDKSVLHGKDIDLDAVRHIYCTDEIDLLSKFLTWWNAPAFSPDIVTGWNSSGFDMPYIYNRICRVMSEEKASLLSPWKKVEKRQYKDKWGNDKEAVNIFGVEQADFMESFIKFGHKYGPQENYKLDTIANTVLGERKLSYDDYFSLFDLSERNPQLYTDYNIRDVNLVERMEARTNLISLVISMAYRGGVNIQDTFGTTRIWDSIIYRYLMDNGVVIQPKKNNQSTKYEGAYVKEISPSSFGYIASFDLASLYPNIMIEWNMSPETIVNGMLSYTPDMFLAEEKIEDPTYSVAANGARFRKDVQGSIPALLEEYYSERKAIQAKEAELHKEKERLVRNGKDTTDLDYELANLFNQQMSIKILINSCYGAMGNAYFRHYDLRIAEGITLTGQLVIKWAAKYINRLMNNLMETVDVDYVCYIDTDSNYINLQPLVDKFKPDSPVDFVDRVCREAITPALDKAWKVLSEQHQTYKPRMSMKREVIADRGIWTSKKRYALRVLDDEGVRLSKPKLKIMGLEAVKSSTPGIVRGWMKEYINLVIDGDQDEAYVFMEDCRRKFLELPIEDIACPRSVKDLNKWENNADLGQFVSRTPFHVKGSLTYNRMIKKNYLDTRHSLIYNGDKIRYLYLITPNPTKNNVIAFPSMLPRELDLEDSVDYNTQFEKVFEVPMASIIQAAGWSNSNMDGFEEFFI